jgi:nucleoid DNA-binding protein
MSKKPMTKSDMIAALAKNAGINKSSARDVLNCLIETCCDEVNSGRPFKISGLGTFTLRESAARKGVNPSTGEPLDIPASKRMGFKASSAVTAMLNPNGKK